ncbi:hypothetical protein [Microcoleus sp. LEGE 07076]|uniref:hypothetical protein n=1 Tax=Microcoleus sp. LEGE 07076 TaxID=915322 RepID=UPI00187EB818|nr:hypothetical protein [Microcoleus sp. LEGE 07076]
MNRPQFVSIHSIAQPPFKTPIYIDRARQIADFTNSGCFESSAPAAEPHPTTRGLGRSGPADNSSTAIASRR